MVVPKGKNYLLKPITFSGPCKSKITLQVKFQCIEKCGVHRGILECLIEVVLIKASGNIFLDNFQLASDRDNSYIYIYMYVYSVCV